MFKSSKVETPYRKTKRYSVSGSLNQEPSDAESQPIDLVYALNCYFDKRTGVLRRRDGSMIEDPGKSLGTPLGISEWLEPASTSVVPVTRTLLANFAGADFKKRVGSTWNAVTVDGNTSFGTSRPTQFAQIGTKLYIAGGRLAKWGGGSTTIERVGYPAPTATPTTAAGPAGGTFAAVTGYLYMFCYYNSTTGLESDWSPVSANTGPFASGSRQYTVVTSTTTGPAALGVSHKRIYRTTDGGNTYYLVTTTTLATATYNDSTLDSALTTPASPQYYKSLPPNETYVFASYASRGWCVDAANPYLIRFSEAYTGSDLTPEYWPVSNYVVSTQPVTALFVMPNRMLVFHPRGFSQITGGSPIDFQFLPLGQGAGTLFPTSVVSDGETVAFLSERGFVEISGDGVRYISKEISKDIDFVLRQNYNSSMYVAGSYYPAIRQFIWTIAAIGSGDAPWEVVGSGALAEWEDTSTLETEGWEDPAGGASDDATRNLCFGWSKEQSTSGGFGQPARQKWHKYTFSKFSDSNATNAIATCMFLPSVGESSLDPQQGILYIGFTDGNAGDILGAFNALLSLDDLVAFPVEWLTGRIDPEPEGRFKRFFTLGFPGAIADPSSDGLTTLKYLLDYDDPLYRGWMSDLITLTDTTDSKNLPYGKGKYLHLYGVDTSNSADKILLSDFYVEYRMSKQREGR